MTLETVVVVVALCFNMLALVWGASKLVAGLDFLRTEVVPKIEQNITTLTDLVHEHDVDINVMKEQMLARRKGDLRDA